MGRYANVNLESLAFLNNSSLSEKQRSFKTINIPIEQIIPNEKNKYSVQDIEELKFSILHNGLKQNLEVYQIEDDLYKLISGERRYTALKALVEEGHGDFSMVPCLVTDFSVNKLPLSEASKEMYAIITTNSESRDFTDADRMFQVRELKKIYTELQNNGVKLTGKMNDLIADDLKISKSQVARYNYIESHGTDELKEKVENNQISVRAAETIAHATPSKQKEMLKKESLTSTEANTELKKVERKKEQRRLNSSKMKKEIIQPEDSNIYQTINCIREKIKVFDLDWNEIIMDRETYKLLSVKLKQLYYILDYIEKTINKQ